MGLTLVPPSMGARRWLWNVPQLILLGIVTVLGLLVIFGVSWHLPNSLIHRHRMETWLKRAEARREQSLEALSLMERWVESQRIPTPLFHQPGPKRLCIGVLSMPRSGGGEDRLYVTQILMALLTRVPLSAQRDIRLTVFNVAAEPEKHVELQRLGHLLKVERARYDLPGLSLAEIVGQRVFVKETVDFVGALRSLHGQEGCGQVMVLEDDALAGRNWWPRVQAALEDLQANKFGDWLYLKLFSPRNWIGWRNETDDIFLLIGLGLLFGLGIYLAVALLLAALHLLQMGWAKRRVASAKSDPEHASLKHSQSGLVDSSGEHPCSRRWLLAWLQPTVAAWFFLHVLGVLALLIPNKQNFIITRPGINRLNVRASMVAVVYNRSHIMPFTDSLIRHLGMPKDLVPYIYMDSAGLTELIHDPDLFEHIGIHSSLSCKTYDQSKLIVSSNFKDNDTPILFDPHTWEL